MGQMELGSWLIFPFVFWWAGKFKTEHDLLLNERYRKGLILPPKWLFFVGGLPKYKTMKTGVMSKHGLGMQIGAIILAVTGISFYFTNNNLGIIFLICFFCLAFDWGLVFSYFRKNMGIFKVAGK